MLVDIIGSRVLRHVTEFKNFPYKVNNFIIDQSILTLTSEPIPTSMKDINTTELTDITIAHRDLNKGQWEKFKKSNSSVLIIDLLGELRSISEYKQSYYNTDSLEYININSGKKLSRVEQFRLLQKYIDDSFIDVLNQYEKVIIVKFIEDNSEESDFIAGIFDMFEEKVENKLLLEYIVGKDIDKFDAPIEFYHEINMDIKRFESDSYESQLLFNELLLDNELSVYMNFIGDREYIYELYKNGKSFKKSKPTRSRFFKFQLKEPAKYRIRVNLVDNSIQPRLSKTYEFTTDSHSNKASQFIEMPDKNNLWLLDVLIDTTNIEGIIGNPFKYGEGYQGIPVYDPSEVKQDFLPASKLLSTALKKISEMDHITFTRFLKNNEDSNNTLLIDFLTYLRSKR
ncbi:MAG TPA: DUF6270 domain-containing protein [Aliicoccus persicus]|uniref:DUF6270 domain-containing protein n=1 Tax=Aliicoccus persicus TaxID=930138 RepID=A0A921JD15_9STAP|nr:DUF6270 domain-containing protein [Aliicoccus persicus]